MPRVDLHVHSSASFDCKTPPDEVARRCRALGLDPVVLTDHDSIDGAIELRRNGIRVIVGQEITSEDGELIGLFIERAIPAGLSAEAAVAEIKAQGGLVYVEHPYDARRRPLRDEAIERIADLIDIVEIWNGRAKPADNRRAEDLRATLGAAPGAGSDAHRADDIGRAYVELAPFTGPQDFLANLRTARVVVEPNRLMLRAKAILGR